MHQLNEMMQHVKEGSRIYKVYALGDASFIETIDVAMMVLCGKDQYWVISTHGQRHSVQDMNGYVEPNTYNFHQAYFEADAAAQYMAACKIAKIGQTNDFDFDSVDFYYGQ